MAADALLVHLPNILSTNMAGELASLRSIVPPHQVWVAESLESAGIYRNLDDAQFMTLFDIEASYRQTADVWMPYIPIEFDQRYARRFFRPRNARCCAFISSSWDASGRQSYMRDLSDHLRIDSFGRFMRNKKLRFDCGIPSKLAVLKRYRFVLAFENSIAPDYVTEKFFEPLMTGCIPIYLGAPNIDEFAPGEHCFINAADFECPADLARFVTSVDPAAYQRWRREPLRREFQEKLALLTAPRDERLLAAIQAARDRRSADHRG